MSLICWKNNVRVKNSEIRVIGLINNLNNIKKKYNNNNYTQTHLGYQTTHCWRVKL